MNLCLYVFTEEVGDLGSGMIHHSTGLFDSTKKAPNGDLPKATGKTTGEMARKNTMIPSDLALFTNDIWWWNPIKIPKNIFVTKRLRYVNIRVDKFRYDKHESKPWYPKPRKLSWRIRIYIQIISILYWLVVGPPLWKIWVRQLGWWLFPIYLGKCQIHGHQTTNQITIYHLRLLVFCFKFWREKRINSS